MRTMTKSPLAVAQEALVVARRAMPAYSCRHSRRDFTQHQLFAILMLQKFMNQDYRGIIAILKDWSDLRRVLGLKKLPHHTTLHYAARRLLKGGSLPG